MKMNEAAIKTRLKKIALDKNTTLNKVWKQLLLERFLARLSNSSYRDNFIFKGGLLLAQYVDIYRETIDIDFLMTKIKNEMQWIKEIIHEVVAHDTNDGFSFTLFLVEELNQPHMDYAGFRLTLDVMFGKMRDKIQIDIGIGDAVKPVDASFSTFQYKGKPIFEGEISLYVYPPEAIYAEKLETIISKGAINSRMKDYHDLLVMIREPDFFDTSALLDAVKATFDRRATKNPSLIQFDESGMMNLQALWRQHLQGLGIFKKQLSFPYSIRDVIDEINHWNLSNQVFLR